MTIGRVKTLVSTNWLREKLMQTTKNGLVNTLRVLDTSWHLDKSVDSYQKCYKQAHIPQSVHFDFNHCVKSTPEIPRNLPDINCFTDYVQHLGIANDTHVIAYDSVNKLPSFRTWWLFRLYGHTKISVLDGGLTKWVDDGFPTTTEEPEYEDSDFQVHVDKNLLFDFEMMKKNILERKSHQIVDARGGVSFIGEDLEALKGDLKHGHMPGARNIPFSKLFNEDGTFKSENALKELFDAAAIDLGQPIVASCLTGMTACGIAAALHLLGKEKVPVYYGSWTEWSQCVDDSLIVTGKS